MRSVGLKVRAVAIFGGLKQELLVNDRGSRERSTKVAGYAHSVEIVVLSYELLELRLHIHDPLRWKFEFHDWDSCFLQMLEKANLGRLQEHQASALAVRSPCGTAHAMDVVAWIIWRVELNNPIHCRNLGRESAGVSRCHKGYRLREYLHLNP